MLIISQKVLNNETKSDSYDDFGVAVVKKYLFTFYVGLPFHNKN